MPTTTGYGVWLTLLLGAFGACGDDAESLLGPECEKQYGSGQCCIETAECNSMAVQGCTQAKDSILNGIRSGNAPSSYESACKTLNDQAASSGRCSPPQQGELGRYCRELFEVTVGESQTCCATVALLEGEDPMACETRRQEILMGDTAAAEAECKSALEAARQNGDCFC